MATTSERAVVQVGRVMLALRRKVAWHAARRADDAASLARSLGLADAPDLAERITLNRRTRITRTRYYATTPRAWTGALLDAQQRLCEANGCECHGWAG